VAYHFGYTLAEIPTKTGDARVQFERIKVPAVLSWQCNTARHVIFAGKARLPSLFLCSKKYFLSFFKLIFYNLKFFNTIILKINFKK